MSNWRDDKILLLIDVLADQILHFGQSESKKM
jgi:hypothetical protein